VITLILIVIVVLLVVDLVTFIRAERKGETFKAALHGEVDAAKKRLTQLEAKIDGGSVPK
jgi:5,10-methylenetetrahydrofolate reductase